MNADAIHKQHFSKNLLLEEYKFVANELSVSLKQSITINVQIALEINYRNKIRVLEMANRSGDNCEPLLPYLTECLNRSPLVEMEAILLTKDIVSIPNVKVQSNDVEHFENVYMIIGSHFLQQSETLRQALDVLIEGGFILTRERSSSCNNYSDMNILTIHSTPFERLVLIAKPKCTFVYKTLRVCNNFEWIKPLQEMLKMDEEVIIYSQVQHTGILGFTNCIRREGNTVRCVYICDEDAPAFDITKSFYQEQLKKGHAINVLKNGVWGTYRCLPINRPHTTQSEHYIFGTVRREGLQSHEWYAGPLTAKVTSNADDSLVYVSSGVKIRSSQQNSYTFTDLLFGVKL